jgi:hypothetical protein
MGRARMDSTIARLMLVGIFLVPLAWPFQGESFATAKYDIRRLPKLFRYIDEEDEEKAGRLLLKLLKKYNKPSKGRSLLKSLRKRPYLPGLSKRETVKHMCTDGLVRDFTYIVPSKYNARMKTGVLVFLHGGISQAPPGCGPQSARNSGAAVRDLRFIVIAPSTYSRHEWGEPANRALIRFALEHVKRRFNVDENRVYIGGTSDGGRGTYAMMETEATFFAAALPNIGAPGGVSRFVNFLNLPWFAINGETDGLFKVDKVRRDIESMKAMGIDMTWKLVKGRGHDAGFFMEFKDEVCAFYGRHTRNPFPKKIEWQLDPSKGEYAKGFPANTFRWLRIEETGDSKGKTDFKDAGRRLVQSSLPRIRAKYEGNRIDVETSLVKKYTVLVSGKMLDLKKEIEIYTNRSLSFKGKLLDDPRVILEEARRFNDRQLLFQNRVTIEVDPKPEEGEEEKDD